MVIMKKFSINCSFGGATAPFTVYIGTPEKGHHPLQFQADWLSKERGGTIPQAVMDSLAKLQEISERNNVPFEELCEYAMQAASIQQPQETKSKAVQADQQSQSQPPAPAQDRDREE